ncbi:MAG: hypothetical protein H5U28_09590 [Burkholderiaceae bacterium]|nr:hypothetical protein [Burkholderiaceae bacterium]
MKTQTRTFPLLPALALAAAFGLAAPAALAQKPHAAYRHHQVEGSALNNVTVSGTGLVVDVDADARQVVIKRPNGGYSIYQVGPEVQNLEKIQRGDMVHVRYRVSVALELAQNGSGVRERVERVGERSLAEGQPGGLARQSITVVANVEAVDRERSVVTLHDANDRLYDVHVSDPARLEKVKVGDQVKARITRSVAIVVEPSSGSH